MFEQVVNVRDLGGLPVGGRRIRSGRLLRTAHLHDASDADVRLLAEHFRLRVIFDFRTFSEAQALPDREVPGAEHILLPTLDVEAERASGEAVPAETWLDLPSHIVRLAFTPLFQQKARELYPSLVISEFSQLQYATFLNKILETPDGAVLWHCSQGKDRAGWASAFVLAALGASREVIVKDFDLSNQSYASKVEALEAQLRGKDGADEAMAFIQAMVGVSRENFEATLDLIDQRYGSLTHLNIALAS